LRENAALDFIFIKFDGNIVVTRGRERVVNSVRSIIEIFNFNVFRGNRSLRSSDCNIEGFTADGFELVGLGFGSDGELEFLDESVVEVGTFLDIDGIRAFGNRVVFQVGVDGVFAVISGMVGYSVSTIIVIDDIDWNITFRSSDLNFERITSASHIVSESVESFDVEDSRFGVISFFESGAINERVVGISSGNDGDIVRTVLDVIVE